MSNFDAIADVYELLIYNKPEWEHKFYAPFIESLIHAIEQALNDPALYNNMDVIREIKDCLIQIKVLETTPRVLH